MSDYTPEQAKRDGYTAARRLPDGRIAAVVAMTYHKGRLVVGCDAGGHSSAY